MTTKPAGELFLVIRSTDNGHPVVAAMKTVKGMWIWHTYIYL